jgi:hypothetical protein
MLIFWRLCFGHLLADFTFQSDFVARWKRKSFWGMLFHCAMHPIAYAALTYPYLSGVWIKIGWLKLSGWLCILAIFLVHLIEDEWRVFTIFKYRTPDNTLYFLWDQFIHLTSIFLLTPYQIVTRWQPGWQGFMPEKWPVLGCLLILATHTSVVLVYFIEKDLYGIPFPKPSEKYFVIAERLLLALACLLPAPLAFLLVPVFLAVMGGARYKGLVGYSRLGFALGAAFAVAFGLAGRAVYYA